MSTESDKKVLEVLHTTTAGQQWGRKKRWISTANLGDWERVFVDKTGRVSQLRLYWNNLTGISSSSTLYGDNM
jgi:hypothetical protein